MQSLPQRIAVTDDVHATRAALTTDLDVRGPPPDPLKDLELIQTPTGSVNPASGLPY